MTETPVVPHLDDSGRPTLRTIGELAGVSVSTVSRVLSTTGGDPARWASVQTVERIKRIALEVGFSKNPHAAGLRTSRSNLVGVLVPRLTDMVLATIYEGISDSARKLGYQTFVTNSYDEAELRKEAADMLLARRVDGVIIGDAVVDDDDLLTSLERREVPFVLVSRRSADYPSVTCDDVVGGGLAARHLLEQGHTEVAIIAGEAYSSTSVDRTAGFRAVYAGAGHPIPQARVLHCPFD
ncbi:MAG: LacI family DNA-binding transcriptional regulator, partial [Mycobacterium sp.]